MAKISVPVLYDETGTYYPNGKLLTISVQSIVIGEGFLPVLENGQQIAALLVKEPYFSLLYLDLTQDEYGALIAAAGGGGSSANTFVKVYRIGIDEPAGNTFTDPALIGKTILIITLNGVDVTQYVVFTSSTGELDFSDPNIGGLTNGSTVRVIYTS